MGAYLRRDLVLHFLLSWMCENPGRSPDCRCQFRGDCASLNLALPSALKPKTQGALSGLALQFLFSSASTRKLRLLPQIQLVDHLFIALAFRAVEIIEQAAALRDHFQKPAPRRMVLRVGLEVFG